MKSPLLIFLCIIILGCSVNIERIPSTFKYGENVVVSSKAHFYFGSHGRVRKIIQQKPNEKYLVEIEGAKYYQTFYADELTVLSEDKDERPIDKSNDDKSPYSYY